MAVSDVKIFQEELKPEDRKLFDDWYEKSGREEIDGILTIPYPDFLLLSHSITPHGITRF